MRNLFLALAAVGVLTVSSSAFAATPDQSIVDSAGQAVVEGVQSNVAMPAPMVDHQMDHSMVGQSMPAQPIAAQPMISHDHSGMVAQPMIVHQHQPAHVHYHRAPAKKQNVFSKLLEMERKKNAWLKKTFLGK